MEESLILVLTEEGVCGFGKMYEVVHLVKDEGPPPWVQIFVTKDYKKIKFITTNCGEATSNRDAAFCKIIPKTKPYGVAAIGNSMMWGPAKFVVFKDEDTARNTKPSIVVRKPNQTPEEWLADEYW